MADLRAEKSLRCRKFAIDRYDALYMKICCAFELIMSYSGGAGKDFFRDQICHFRLLTLQLHLKQARRDKGDEKSLTLRHHKCLNYGPPAQDKTALLMRLPSGEYKLKQSRHCKVFSAPLPRLHATMWLS
jgi:hypothetical protein